MRHKFYAVAVVIAIVLITAGSVSFSQLLTRNDAYLEQFRGVSQVKVVSKVWLDICAANREHFPDSNRVFPGDKYSQQHYRQPNKQRE